MTKEITKARIIQEISDKFKLREFEPEIFAFSERVIPVYNIGEHLLQAETSYKERSITATGGVEFFTVPDDERWFLNTYNVVFMGAGAFTVAGGYITRRGVVATFVYLDLAAAQTVSYAVDLPKQIRLEPGDTLNINIDGYTSTQNLRMYIDFLREEIR